MKTKQTTLFVTILAALLLPVSPSAISATGGSEKTPPQTEQQPPPRADRRDTNEAQRRDERVRDTRRGRRGDRDGRGAATKPARTGVLCNKAGAFGGYTLFAPLRSTTTYLIDAQGVIRERLIGFFNVAAINKLVAPYVGRLGNGVE